jgi:hypothetical protein
MDWLRCFPPRAVAGCDLRVIGHVAQQQTKDGEKNTEQTKCGANKQKRRRMKCRAGSKYFLSI